ncbi:tape measure protein [Limosilactobacillus mucosae]|uniref:Tape measure protein n=1 Tax=Limosilactobacillus mucosae TaxID=97478 RepID=A0AAJ1HXU2_LIMMU|nr:tape measure protein [Limosilactobacillus mucosae]MDC2830400.1 tape measure protein [Limosilactobacillus mucosae]MDC2837974.1 tape measure protein [Limosilactobacillus mucosae]MDC2849987.1 tape measure protein [Limosilactobacillus mucosae]MDC2854109.1 tape measure protein [Limosilactobacillus mucosae]
MADGRIDIDVIVNDQATESAKKIDEMLKGLGDDAGDQASKSIKDNMDQAVKATDEAHDSMQQTMDKPIKPKVDDDEANDKLKRFSGNVKDIPKSTKTVLKSEAEKQGIDNFNVLLKALPKEQLTKLVAKAEKGEAIDYEALIKKLPASVVTKLDLNDNASPKLRQVQAQAQQTGEQFTSLKEIIKGTFVGSLLSNGVGMITGYLKDMTGEALEASDAMDKFKSTMQLGGYGSEEIKRSAKEVKDYANETVYDLGDISSTTAKLASNGIKNYMGLTEAAGNLNAQAGGTAETFKSVAMVMTQTAGAGKLTTENWNQLEDAIPGASGVLQKAMKDNAAYTGNFRDAMADGQITSDEFFKAVEKLGTTKGAEKAAKSTETFEGAIGNLHAQVIQGLDDTIDKMGKKRITNMINATTDAVTVLTTGVLKMFDMIAEHKQIAITLGAILTSVFATRKVLDFISVLGSAKRAMVEFGIASKAAEGFSLPQGAGTLTGAAGLGMRAVSAVGVAAPVGFAAYGAGDAIVNGRDTGSKVGGAAGSITGATTGALIGRLAGGALGSVGGPIGIAIGQSIGQVLGGAGGTKIGKEIGESVGHNIEEHFKGHPIEVRTKLKVDKETNDFAKITTPTANKITQTVLRMDVDSQSIAKAKAKTDAYYNELNQKVDNYYKNKEAKAQADLQKLVKNGAMSQADADKRIANLQKSDQKAASARKASYAQMQKDTNAYYDQVQKIESNGTNKLYQLAQKYGANSKQVEKEREKELRKARQDYIAQEYKDQVAANSKISKYVQQGADTQKKIYEKLIKDKGKLDTQDLKATQKSADQKYRAAVEPAKKTRDEVVKNANSQYKETVKAAEKEYKEHHTISKKKYEEIVENAKKQRDGDVDAADDEYRKTTKKARDQHKKVTDEINKQKEEVINAANDQAAGHASAADNEESQTNSHYAEGSKKTATIWNKLGKHINKVLKVFEASQTVPMIPEAYATGTGALPTSQLALVGEEGFELAHTPRGYELLGAGGPELRFLDAGTSILTHEQSKAAIAMNGGKIPGYAKGTGAKIEDFIDSAGDKLGDAFDLVGKSASEIWETIKKSTGIDKMLNALEHPYFTYDRGNGSIHLAANAVGDFIKKMADKFMEKIGGAGVSDSLVKAAASMMHTEVSGGDVSHILNVIKHESGGRANAINLWDSNAQKGTPSKGILQFIDSTFMKYAMPGHTNIWNPLDQLLAMFNDTSWRSDLTLGGWGPVGGRRFANGGWAFEPAIFGEVPGQPEVAINPRRDTADGLIAEAIQARAKVNPNGIAGKLSQLINNTKSAANSMMPVFATSNGGHAGQSASANGKVDMSGDMTISVQLDSNTIARTTYPKIKAIKAQEIIVRGNGGAIPVGNAMPVGGGF